MKGWQQHFPFRRTQKRMRKRDADADAHCQDHCYKLGTQVCRKQGPKDGGDNKVVDELLSSGPPLKHCHWTHVNSSSVSSPKMLHQPRVAVECLQRERCPCGGRRRHRRSLAQAFIEEDAVGENLSAPCNDSFDSNMGAGLSPTAPLPSTPRSSSAASLPFTPTPTKSRHSASNMIAMMKSSSCRYEGIHELKGSLQCQYQLGARVSVDLERRSSRALSDKGQCSVKDLGLPCSSSHVWRSFFDSKASARVWVQEEDEFSMNDAGLPSVLGTDLIDNGKRFKLRWKQNAKAAALAPRAPSVPPSPMCNGCGGVSSHTQSPVNKILCFFNTKMRPTSSAINQRMRSISGRPSGASGSCHVDLQSAIAHCKQSMMSGHRIQLGQYCSDHM
ncbi:hypothetical protein KP509_15G051400 [Ceratopteris richardii]|uniref:Uncharacterized protein n=1 Tax=Ceratopteris richardii TaxID=49495 RepID=A0A8T2T6Z0_CERRI|nr:hypothetical protein KP509_15G051400 [Ceratopteris richardii]